MSGVDAFITTVSVVGALSGIVGLIPVDAHPPEKRDHTFVKMGWVFVMFSAFAIFFHSLNPPPAPLASNAICIPIYVAMCLMGILMIKVPDSGQCPNGSQ